MINKYLKVTIGIVLTGFSAACSDAHALYDKAPANIVTTAVNYGGTRACAATFDYSFFTPPGNLGSVPDLSYSSHNNRWGLNTSAIATDSEGRRFYISGNGAAEEIFILPNGEYRTRLGERFVSLGQGLAKWEADGKLTHFTVLSSKYDLSAGYSSFYLPEKIVDTRGSSTAFYYLSNGNQAYLVRIEGDIIPGESPIWSAEFSYDDLNQLIATKVNYQNVSGSLGLIREYAISHENGFLKSIKELGPDGLLGNSTELTYYSDSFPSLLKSAKNTLGGNTTFKYKQTKLLGKNVAILDTQTDFDLKTEHSTKFTCSGPIVRNNQLLGFSTIAAELPDYQKILSTYSDENNSKVGVLKSLQQFGHDASLVFESHRDYQFGGYNNKFLAEFRKLENAISPNQSIKTTALEQHYDFINERYDRIIDYGEVSVDSTLSSIIDNTPQDSNEIIYTYNQYSLGQLLYNLPSKIENAVGNKLISATEFKYVLNFGELEETTEWLNINNASQKTTFQYDVKGFLTSITKGNSTTTYEYDRLQVKKATLNNKFSTTYSYSDSSFLASIKHATGISEVTIRDSLGRVTEVNRIGSDGKTKQPLVKAVLYNIGGTTSTNFVEVTHSDSTKTKTFFDGFGIAIENQTTATNGKAKTQKASYDQFGLSAIFNPQFTDNQISPSGLMFDYTPWGTTQSITQFPNSDFGGTINFDYGVESAKAVGVTDQMQRRVSLAPEANVLTLRAGQGNDRREIQTTFLNDSFKKVTTDLISQKSWSNTKDSLGQLRKIEGESTPSVEIDYTNEGLIKTVTDAETIASRSYDQYNRLTKIAVSSKTNLNDKDEIQINYDSSTKSGYYVPLGSLARISGKNDLVHFSYDALGRLNKFCQILKNTPEVDPTICHEFTFVRNPQGQIIKVVYPNKVGINISYDKFGNPQKWTTSSTTEFWNEGLIAEIVERNAKNQITKRISSGGKFEEVLSFDETTSLLTDFVLTKKLTPSSSQQLYKETRSYDQSGIIKNIVKTFKNGSNQSASLEHDALKRFSKSTVINTGNEEVILDQEYDQFGRPTNNPVKGIETLEYNGSDFYLPSKLTDSKGKSFSVSYSPNKEPLSGVNNTSYSYNVWGELERSQLPSKGLTVDYVHGVLGSLISVSEKYANGQESRHVYFGPGLYELQTNISADGNVTQTNIAYVHGELTAFEPKSNRFGVIAKLLFPVASGQLKSASTPQEATSTASSDTGKAPGGTTEPSKKKPVPPPTPPPTPTPTPKPEPRPYDPGDPLPPPAIPPTPEPTEGGYGSEVTSGPCTNAESNVCGSQEGDKQYGSKAGSSSSEKKYDDGTASKDPCEKEVVEVVGYDAAELNNDANLDLIEKTFQEADPNDLFILQGQEEEGFFDNEYVCFAGDIAWGFVPGSGLVDAYEEYEKDGITFYVCLNVASEIPGPKQIKGLVKGGSEIVIVAVKKAKGPLTDLCKDIKAFFKSLHVDESGASLLPGNGAWGIGSVPSASGRAYADKLILGSDNACNALERARARLINLRVGDVRMVDGINAYGSRAGGTYRRIGPRECSDLDLMLDLHIYATEGRNAPWVQKVLGEIAEDFKKEAGYELSLKSSKVIFPDGTSGVPLSSPMIDLFR